MPTMQRAFSVALAICAVVGFTVADYRNDALKLHNRYRKKHHAPPLSLCDRLNKEADNWAKEMARTDDFDHSDSKDGENIYWTSDTSLSDSEAVIEATKDWYSEVSDYKYNRPGYSDDTGHFTQLVWKNTKYMGIGIGRAKTGVYVCANYSPPGNYPNQFRENVLKP